MGAKIEHSKAKKDITTNSKGKSDARTTCN